MTRDTNSTPKTAVLYRMVMEEHVCPYGLKSKDLLEREGYAIDDRPLKTREETEAFMEEYGVETTPQTFIDDERIGGYDALREFFGQDVKDDDETTYQPVIAISEESSGTGKSLAAASDRFGGWGGARDRRSVFWGHFDSLLLE